MPGRTTPPEMQAGDETKKAAPSEGGVPAAPKWQLWTGAHNDVSRGLYKLVNPQFKHDRMLSEYALPFGTKGDVHYPLDGASWKAFDGGPSHGNAIGLAGQNSSFKAAWDIYSSHSLNLSGSAEIDRWQGSTLPFQKYKEIPNNLERPNIGVFSATAAHRIDHASTEKRAVTHQTTLGGHVSVNDPSNFTENIQKWAHQGNKPEVETKDGYVFYRVRVPDYDKASGERQLVSGTGVLQHTVTHHGAIGRLETNLAATAGVAGGIGVRNGDFQNISSRYGYNNAHGAIEARIGKNLASLPANTVALDPENQHQLPFAPKENKKYAVGLGVRYTQHYSITPNPLMVPEVESPQVTNYRYESIIKDRPASSVRGMIPHETSASFTSKPSVGHLDVAVLAKLGKFLGEVGVSTNVNDPNHREGEFSPRIRTPNIYLKAAWQLGGK